jgi:hypothetical protein
MSDETKGYLANARWRMAEAAKELARLEALAAALGAPGAEIASGIAALRKALEATTADSMRDLAAKARR